MSTKRIFGFLFLFFLCSLPAILMSQPRIVVVTDAIGRPTCQSDIINFADTTDVSTNASFCALISRGGQKVEINEVFNYAFCNGLYDTLIIRTQNKDQANNILTIDLGNGTTSDYYGYGIDINNPENSLPTNEGLSVNVNSQHTVVSIEMDYDPNLILGFNTTEILTIYEVFAYNSVSASWYKIASDSSYASTCTSQSGNSKLYQDSPAQVNIFPNPASQRLNLTSSVDEIDEVQIIDFQGRQYPIKYLSSNSAKYALDITNLRTGLYMLRIKTPSGWTTQKWVKE